MNTKITLRGMRFYASHGCYATEQRVGGRFRVDLSVEYDGQRAALSDDVARAVNYLDVYQVVREQMMIPSHVLENVAQRTLRALMERFSQINQATITVEKLSPPLGGDIEAVSVTLTSCR